MADGNDRNLTEQQTLELLASLNESFLAAANELHDAVKDMDAGGTYNGKDGVADRVQGAVNAIDAPTDELLAFLGEIEVADVPSKTFYCLNCGCQVDVEEAVSDDPDVPDFSGECSECGCAWEIFSYDAGNGSGSGVEGREKPPDIASGESPSPEKEGIPGPSEGSSVPESGGEVPQEDI